jgi:hypothetical protein
MATRRSRGPRRSGARRPADDLPAPFGSVPAIADMFDALPEAVRPKFLEAVEVAALYMPNPPDALLADLERAVGYMPPEEQFARMREFVAKWGPRGVA